MNNQTNKPNRSKVNLMIDFVIFLGFLIGSAPHFTGMAIHEWLGLAFGAGIVTHLLLHWQWVVETSKRIFSKLPGKTRINYILNIALFIAVTLIAFTGVMISETALPALGITLSENHAWTMVHKLSADISVFLIGLHVALHWQWIVDAARRYIVAPISSRVWPTAKPKAAALRTH